MKTLFKRNKNKSVNQWQCFAEGADVVTVYGKVGGKLMTERYTAEGKNAGKKNETTPEQQAILEVESKYRHQIDRKGYAENLDEAETVIKDGVMLAHDAVKISHKKYLIFPADAQPKLDGVRCRIKRDSSVENGFTAYSRENTEYVMPNMLIPSIQFMLKSHPTVEQFDGEIYAHGYDLEDIVSMIKDAENPERDTLMFYWYDIIDSSLNWPERSAIINSSPLLECDFNLRIVVVESTRVNSFEEFDAMHDKWVLEKYEGAMYRSIAADSFYGCNERSYFLIKHKKMLTSEFIIVDVEKDKRGHGKFVCLSSKGKRFSCAWKTTHEKRQYLADNPEEFIGKPLTVQYQKETRKGRVQFPVGLTVRDYE